MELLLVKLLSDVLVLVKSGGAGFELGDGLNKKPSSDCSFLPLMFNSVKHPGWLSSFFNFNCLDTPPIYIEYHIGEPNLLSISLNVPWSDIGLNMLLACSAAKLGYSVFLSTASLVKPALKST